MKKLWILVAALLIIGAVELGLFAVSAVGLGTSNPHSVPALSPRDLQSAAAVPRAAARATLQDSTAPPVSPPASGPSRPPPVSPPVGQPNPPPPVSPPVGQPTPPPPVSTPARPPVSPPPVSTPPSPPVSPPSFPSIKLPPPGGIERLYPGCNSIVLTFPDGTLCGDVVQAVSPTDAVESLWRFSVALRKYEGFSPTVPEASDLLTLDFLDVVWICLAN